MAAPERPQIYHITNVDNLASIVADGYLFCDSCISKHPKPGTTIGMASVKQSRMRQPLESHRSPQLYVGDCVPFNFCPRSVMLHAIHVRHPELAYKGGQEPIVHLQVDVFDTVTWANANERRWALTTSNANARLSEDYADLSMLDRIDWQAVRARQWGGAGVDPALKVGKQAEFLVEEMVPWTLVNQIGCHSESVAALAEWAITGSSHKPRVTITPSWYY